MSTAVSTEQMTMPPWYMKPEKPSMKAIMQMMPASESTPMTSSRLMVREGTLRVPCSVRAWPGQNSESHAPMRREQARVSVP